MNSLRFVRFEYDESKLKKTNNLNLISHKRRSDFVFQTASDFSEILRIGSKISFLCESNQYSRQKYG